MANLNNFSSAGSVSVNVSVGDTVDGVTITGAVDNGGHHVKGTAGNDYLVGGDNRATVIGGAGNDVLSGGGGPTTFVFNVGSGQDVVTNFSAGDELKLSDYTRHGDGILLHDTTAGVVVEMSTGDSVTLLGVHTSDLIPTSAGYVHC
jgi:Ca2+-binding RTX toxin-like protein